MSYNINLLYTSFSCTRMKKNSFQDRENVYNSLELAKNGQDWPRMTKNGQELAQNFLTKD